MNKIVFKDELLEVKDNAINLEIVSNKLVIKVEGKVLINEVNIKDREDLELDIVMEPNSSLIYNRFIIHKIMNNKINIKQDCNSEVIFNYSMISKDVGNLDIRSTLEGNNNDTEINIRSITLDNGKLKIVSNGEAYPKIVDNNLIEDIKIMMLNDEENVIIPNLLVASNEVAINHAATISSIDKDELFYLNSKGLDDEEAIKLIRDGFLLGNLNINEDIKNKIKDILGMN